MLNSSERVISCPYCKWEYMLGEIFVPNYTIGQQTNVQRDKEGKILGYDGIPSRFWESYVCDNCNKKFYARLSISIKCDKPEQTSEEFVQDITTKDKKIYLKED